MAAETRGREGAGFSGPLLPLWGSGPWSLEESGWEAGVKSERKREMDQIDSWLGSHVEGQAGRQAGGGGGSLGVPVPNQAQ